MLNHCIDINSRTSFSDICGRRNQYVWQDIPSFFSRKLKLYELYLFFLKYNIIQHAIRAILPTSVIFLDSVTSQDVNNNIDSVVFHFCNIFSKAVHFIMPDVHKRPKSAHGRASNRGSSGKQTVDSPTDSTSTFLSAVRDWDEKYTAMCAVCANKSSTLSYLRPLMKLVEISCHGIPWIFGTIVLLLSVHHALHVEILVNLFYGKIY